ncbi:MAG: nitrile hydratase accessory protein [Gammaproteobacteria bacterium]|nr:nitrile hydratase accessory protein [Gammaproteobacteria bacterium]MDH3448036.1 nitrile hydratase accessory protein [Gammaproteobacteria bacterium]
MSEVDANALKPLAAVDGEPAFEEPWQAQVLAIADTLVQNGMFSAGEWSEALGAALQQAASASAVDNQETYYRCALDALETLVARHSEIDESAMSGKRKAWEEAYLSTPHGQPVNLKVE